MGQLKKISTAILRAGDTAVNLILPPRCIASGHTVDRLGTISPEFWAKLQFIDNPMCACCGTPFEFEMEPGTICGHCLQNPPDFDCARSVLVYEDISRSMILKFKYGDQLNAHITFGRWLVRAGQEFLDTTDILVPVPLHHKRLWQRRFNQSALLAQSVADQTDITCIPDLLRRMKNTPQQRGLSAKDRQKNVKGAFGVHPKWKETLQGKTVTLIDDVYTSGATLNECARCLLAAGAAAVNTLTLARVCKT